MSNWIGPCWECGSRVDVKSVNGKTACPNHATKQNNSKED